MKKNLILAAGIILMAPLASVAQSSADAPAIVQRVKLMYDLNTLSPKDGDNAYFNGFGAGYDIDFRVSSTMPIYVGTGLDVRGAWHGEKIIESGDYNPVDIQVNSTLVNLNMPINVSYRVPVAQDFYLTPQLGLDFRVQLYGHSKVENVVKLDHDDDLDLGDYSVNLFSDKDMNGDKLRRFQFGWHAAVIAEYQRISLGLSYGTDFVKLHKNLGGSNFLVSVGYTF